LRIAIASNRVTPDCPRYCGGNAFKELHINSGGQRYLNGLLYSPSESSVPFMLGLAEFLSNAVPIISSFMELLFGRF